MTPREVLVAAKALIESSEITAEAALYQACRGDTRSFLDTFRVLGQPGVKHHKGGVLHHLETLSQTAVLAWFQRAIESAS